MLLFGKSLTEIRKQSTFVKEFRVFIHEREGFVNTFMLNGGRPQIIVPGLDQKLQIQKPQQLHYVIKYIYFNTYLAVTFLSKKCITDLERKS